MSKSSVTYPLFQDYFFSSLNLKVKNIIDNKQKAKMRIALGNNVSTNIKLSKVKSLK